MLRKSPKVAGKNCKARACCRILNRSKPTSHKITYIQVIISCTLSWEHQHQHCMLHSTAQIVASSTTIRHRAVATERTTVKLVHTLSTEVATQRAHFPSLRQLLSHCSLCMCVNHPQGQQWLWTTTWCEPWLSGSVPPGTMHQDKP